MRSIRTQMMLFFSLLILLPIILSSVNVYYELQRYLERSYTRHQAQANANLAAELDVFRAKQEELTLRVFGDRAVQDFLSTPMPAPSADQVEKTTLFRQALRGYAASAEPGVSLYVVKGQAAIYGENLSPDVERYIRLRFAAADAAGGRAVWDNADALGRAVLIRRINDNETDLNRGIGYVALLVSRDQLEGLIRRYTLDEGQQFAVYDTNGGFAVNTDAQMPTAFVRRLGDERAAVATGSFDADYDGRSYVFFADSLGSWRLVSWIPHSLVMNPARETLLGILFTALVLLFFSVFMALFLSHRITRPLKLLQRKMKQIGAGGLAVRTPVVRQDEIGELAVAMNRMSDEIVGLIAKNKEEEAKRRLLQLQTLEYQINPHFLYNTLDSVNMLARKHDDPVIADIVTYLSRLFRIGLNQGRELITVAGELSHVTYYLKIQEIRFAGQLGWDIQADESIADERIIKFLLQPLAENSINHGIRRRADGGNIYIRAWGEPDAIVLEVEDDGAGMEPAQLERVRAGLEAEDADPDQDHGFGLRNVHGRIRLHYGPDYGLAIASESGCGTTVTVRLPRAGTGADGGAARGK